jgi:hypothetical protein
MKTRFVLLISFLLLAPLASAKWTIEEFDDSPDPGEPDSYIAQESSGGLKPVNPDQVVQQGNRFYVRQKFEDPFGDEPASYQIFQGKATDAAKSLGKISLEGIPYSTLVRMKLFYSRNAKGDDDLENVYFDGKDIFVEGEDPVYINLNGKMEELKPTATRDFKISITSDPAGATVMVGSSDKGRTPVTFSVPSSKPITAVISSEGYYPVIKPITPNEKQIVQEGVLLNERKPLNNPSTAFKNQLQTALSKKDVNTIKTLRTDIQKILSNYNSETKKAIDAAMSKFPANPAKTSAESSSDFSARKTIWENAQAREKEALNKEGQSYFNELKDLLADVEASISDLDFNLRYEYISNSAITFNKFSSKDFSININLNNARIRFSSKDTRVSTGDTQRDEIADNEDYVHGVLKIWDAPNENGKYASIYDIAIFYDEIPLKVISKGSITLPDATSASKSTEKDLNNRIAKLSGKDAWERRDENATLETLRSNGGGAPPPKPAVAAKVPPPPPQYDDEDAYYDEEEDEEEFEDGMYEQERQDYSRYKATTSASDIFGNTDEYLFWTGMLFAAAAIGTGVVGFLENKKWQEANDAISAIDSQRKETIRLIEGACEAAADPAKCKSDWIYYSEQPPDSWPAGPGWVDDDGNSTSSDPRGTLWYLNNYKKKNSDIRDQRNMNRIIWFSGAGLSALVSIVLFAW